MEDIRALDNKIEELLDSGHEDRVYGMVIGLKAEDIEEAIHDLDPNYKIRVLRLLPKDLAFEVFEKLDHFSQAGLVEFMEEDEFDYVMSGLYFDDKIDLLGELPEEIQEEVKDNSSYTESTLIDKFLNYPEDSAGSIMTIEYLVLDEDMTVKEALRHIKEVGMTKETIYTCYVVDKTSKLVGILSLRDLVTSKENELIGDIMNTDYVWVNIHDDREEVADLLAAYDFLSLPVVDDDMKLQGIVTIDDIMEVIEEETTEDFQKMAAIAPHEEEYLDIPALSLAKNRLGWLLIFMVTSTFTGAIISSYEDMLSKITVISVYMPMLMSTGGNSGNQASATIIRGLATGDIVISDWLKVFFKEFSVAIICSIVISLVNFFKLLLFDRVGFDIGLTVSISLVFTVIMAKLVGSMLPIIAEKLGLDPAIMAGPLITTIVDAGSLILYLQFASMILSI